MLYHSSRYGSSIYVACALVFLAGTFCVSEDPKDILRCVTFGSAGMRLFQRFKSSVLTTGSMKARIAGPFYAICSPWGEHWSVVGPAMWRIGVEAVQDGEYEYSGYCVWHTAGMRYYVGEPLKQLDRGCIEMINIARRIGRTNQIAFAVHTHQLVQKLIKAKRLDEPFLINGEKRTDDEVIRSLIDDKCFLFAHFMLAYQIQYRYYARDYEGACQVIPQLEATREASAGHVYFAMDLFFTALSLLRNISLGPSLIRRLRYRYEHAEECESDELSLSLKDDIHPSTSDKEVGENMNSELSPTDPIYVADRAIASLRLAAIRSQLAYVQRRLKGWNITSPMNFSHRVHLLEAEFLRVRCIVDGRMDLLAIVDARYRLAIQHARLNEYIQDEGLACELEGRWHLEMGRYDEAVASLRAAYKCYTKWQCRLKMDDMKKEFSHHEILLEHATTQPHPHPHHAVHTTGAHLDYGTGDVSSSSVAPASASASIHRYPTSSSPPMTSLPAAASSSSSQHRAHARPRPELFLQLDSDDLFGPAVVSSASRDESNSSTSTNSGGLLSGGTPTSGDSTPTSNPAMVDFDATQSTAAATVAVTGGSSGSGGVASVGGQGVVSSLESNVTATSPPGTGPISSPTVIQRGSSTGSNSSSRTGSRTTSNSNSKAASKHNLIDAAAGTSRGISVASLGAFSPDKSLDLDLLTILKFAQTFSVEVDPQLMLQKIMTAIIQSAGASRGVLVLQDMDHPEVWHVELQSYVHEEKNMDVTTIVRNQSGLADNDGKTKTDGHVTPSTSANTSPNTSVHGCTPTENSAAMIGTPISSREELAAAMPLTVFHYTLNSRDVLVLSDPSNLHSNASNVIATANASGSSGATPYGPLLSDPYFASHHPRALIAAPILRHGQVIGCLYMENNTNTHAFTALNTLLLQLLCSQAALSIHNSRLYARLHLSHGQLEQQVAERTLELERRNAQLEEEIIERQKAEQLMLEAKNAAEHAAKSKSEFLSNMSHELRTPMNAVLGLSRLLLSTELTQEQEQYLLMIANSGHLLLTIINDILDFSKIEAGRLELEKQSLNLLEVIETAVMLCENAAASAGLDLHYRVQAEACQTFMIDATRLQQILLNLLSNALKFTSAPGSVALTVTVRLLDTPPKPAATGSASSTPVVVTPATSTPTLTPSKVSETSEEKKDTPKGGEIIQTPSSTSSPSNNSSNAPRGPLVEITFEVHDTGIGLKESDISSLFQSFHQVQSMHRQFGGTGLGLVISKRLAEKMGGRIWVRSQFGVGSTFGFCIVTEKVTTPEDAATDEMHDGTSPPTLAQNSTILPFPAPASSNDTVTPSHQSSMSSSTSSPSSTISTIPRTLSPVTNPCGLTKLECQRLASTNAVLVSRTFGGSMESYAALLRIYGAEATVYPSLQLAHQAGFEQAIGSRPIQLLILMESELSSRASETSLGVGAGSSSNGGVGLGLGAANGGGSSGSSGIGEFHLRDRLLWSRLHPKLRVLWITNRRYPSSESNLSQHASQSSTPVEFLSPAQTSLQRSLGFETTPSALSSLASTDSNSNPTPQPLSDVEASERHALLISRISPIVRPRVAYNLGAGVASTLAPDTRSLHVSPLLQSSSRLSGVAQSNSTTGAMFGSSVMGAASAYSSPGMGTRDLATCGADLISAYLSKPFKYRMFLQTVLDLLNQSDDQLSTSSTSTNAPNKILSSPLSSSRRIYNRSLSSSSGGLGSTSVSGSKHQMKESEVMIRTAARTTPTAMSTLTRDSSGGTNITGGLANSSNGTGASFQLPPWPRSSIDMTHTPTGFPPVEERNEAGSPAATPTDDVPPFVPTLQYPLTGEKEDGLTPTSVASTPVPLPLPAGSPLPSTSSSSSSTVTESAPSASPMSSTKSSPPASSPSASTSTSSRSGYRINQIASKAPMRLLLAEDNLINQKMMLMILSKLGYSNVLLAANGQECLDLIERVEDEPSDDVGHRGPVETILMDASMDIMDGLECSRRIRARQRPDRPRPFIIAQTANVSKEFQAKCLEAGMDAFLSKPINLDLLTSALLNANDHIHTRRRRQPLNSNGHSTK